MECCMQERRHDECIEHCEQELGKCKKGYKMNLQASYGKEPFDLRLTVLLFCRNIGWILVVTLVGTLIFAGEYILSKVAFAPDLGYEASSMYKVEYVIDPNESGAYYINETSWNSFLHTQEFLDGVMTHLEELSETGDADAARALDYSQEELSAMLSATLPSDLRVPVTTVTAPDDGLCLAIAAAVEETMSGEFVVGAVEITGIRVIDPADSAQKVTEDVRPGHAITLAAVLCFFFASLFFLLKELGEDGLWLPAQLRIRYGLKCVGTLEDAALSENVKYILGGGADAGEGGGVSNGTENGADAAVDVGAESEADGGVAVGAGDTGEAGQIAVCAATDAVDPTEAVGLLKEKMGAAWCKAHELLPVPTPLLCPEVCETLRNADAVLLVVPAGAGESNRLEAVLELLAVQEITVSGAMLWNADEKLIRAYYRIPFAQA